MKKGWRILLMVGVVMYGVKTGAICSAAVAEEPQPSAAKAAVAPVVPATVVPAEVAATNFTAPQERQRIRGVEQALSKFSEEIAAKVHNELQEEGAIQSTDIVAVVSAVPLSDLKRETEFGRLMAEYLMTDLADQGLQVTELRLGKEITILPQSGEFIMTRNIGELKNPVPRPDFVMVSTFSNTRNSLVVQGRLVSQKTGVVVTSWRFSMPMSRELIGLFREVQEKPLTIAVKGID